MTAEPAATEAVGDGQEGHRGEDGGSDRNEHAAERGNTHGRVLPETYQ